MEGRNLMYAVVIFTSESNEYVSAAPKQWIDENEKTLMWPKAKGMERKAINLNMKPENDWNKYTNIKVVGYYATLKEATVVEKAKQCSSASEPEDHLGKRKITINRRYRDDSVSPPPRPPTPQAQTVQKATGKKAITTVVEEQLLGSDSESKDQSATGKKAITTVVEEQLLGSDSESKDQSVSGENTSITVEEQLLSSDVFKGLTHLDVDVDSTLTSNDILRAKIVFKDDDDVHLISEKTSSRQSTSSVFGDMMSELKEIRSLVTYAIHPVENVEKILRNERVCQTQLNLLPNLPLTELTQLEAFEANLADKRIEQQLYDILKYTGGSRERDCVNRCLEKNFSNYLAQFCSWTGKKQNLSTLKLMATLKLAVKESFPNMTDESFERHVMSWFQHATTRLKRLSQH